MYLTGIQQFQLRNELNSKEQAEKTLRNIKNMGFEGIEINGFMVRKIGWKVRLLTCMAGMAIGNSGLLDWKSLLKEADLKTIAFHDYLDHILGTPEEVASEVKSFNTNKVVITGLRKYDYSNREEVIKLADKLNTAGELMQQHGLRLSYHNHNCEFQKVELNKTAFDLLIENTSPDLVDFEFDTFWAIDAGVDCVQMMRKLGKRQSLLHLTDRGIRSNGPTSSILKADCMELGQGTMNLVNIIKQAKLNEIDALVLETHRNWINKSAIESAEVSMEYLNSFTN